MVASLLTDYAATNAQVEAERIAADAGRQEVVRKRRFHVGLDEFRRSEVSLQGGFAFAVV